MLKESMDLDIAIQETRQLFNKFPANFRPKKSKRPIAARTPEEARAIARAVYYSVKQAEKDGFIVKVQGGYKMSWT